MDRPPSPLAEIASSPDIGCISKAAAVYRSIIFMKDESEQSDVMTNLQYVGEAYVGAAAASNASALSRKSTASTIKAPG